MGKSIWQKHEDGGYSGYNEDCIGKVKLFDIIKDEQPSKEERGMVEHIKVWLRNSMSFHHRIMMRYLQKRGWVVFYLEPQNRKCNGECWLKLYEGAS